LHALLRKLCFIVFGITAFVSLAERFNPVNIAFAVVVGLFFAFLYKAFLSGLLGLFNPDLKKEHGKKIISYAVEKSMAFIIPFAVMAFLSKFIVGWSITGAFVSAGLMATGVAASMEVGKLKGRQEIKNTILTSGIAWAFSTLWLFSTGLLVRVPGYIEGGVRLISTLAGNLR
jgi:hypothetical protein